MTLNRSCLVWVLVSGALGGCTSAVEGIGSLPSPPCRYGNVFLTGTIADIGGGCVSVRVEHVIAEAADRDSMELSEGALVHGHLGTMYAYKHAFSAGESVALFVQPNGEELFLQLFPYEDDRVQAQWATASLSLELAEMSADDCPQRLADRRPEQREISPKSGVVQASPPPDEVSCALR